MNYQQCTRCVMDTTTPDITFDDTGVCNYCKTFQVRLAANKRIVEQEQAHRDEFLDRVRADGQGRRYDCVVGVSGGVDSSYALYLAVKSGLRPLAVHLDNGWNSELAVHNISSLVTNLGVDLHTHVIDWPENRDLQLSLFKAHVVDIEMLMDNAMMAMNYEQAAANGVHFILAGTNIATEGLAMPPGWNHFKMDVKNIRRIHAKFGSLPIKSHPLLSVNRWIWFEYMKKIKWISFLDFFPYGKNEALEVLKREVGYKPYPYKHYESVFTRFYQGYILPKKFGVDKRRVHLSTLVASGQMRRDEALELLTHSPYPDSEQERQDKEFVMKKLGFTLDTFEEYMTHPGAPHAKYGTEEPWYRLLGSIGKRLRLRRPGEA